MGYTFAAALVKKAGRTIPGTRKAFREAMEKMGYCKAASAEEAARSMRMYQDKKSAWLSLSLEMPEDLGKELEFLRTLAAEMRTPILYFMNFDSDFLLIAATDGEQVQCTHIGYADDEDGDLPADSDDLSIFDAQLPDDAARAEFRRILAVDMEERIFSESAAQEMAALFGYTPEVLFIDEDAPPFAELHFDLPGKEAVPFLMPEDALPALRVGQMALENPADIQIFSNGGIGKGIRVVLQADGYDANDWELPVLWLNSHSPVVHDGLSTKLVYSEKVIPKRCKFQDGKEGWIAEFPEAPIYRGTNPASPHEYAGKGYDYHFAHCNTLHIAFCGGTFSPKVLKEPDVDMLRDPEQMLSWYIQRQEFEQQSPEGQTHIWIVPVQNPEKGAHGSIPRKPFRKDIPHDWLRGYWPDDELK